jgi:hypothetical protein
MAKREISKLRKSAQGRECTVRIPGKCNFNPETTVLAHLNIGGMGQKAPDIFGAFCCSSCHSAIDGHTTTKYTHEQLKLMHLEAVIRTQEIWLRAGLIAMLF